MTCLSERGLICTVEGLDPFIPKFIREWYCNMSEQFGTPCTPKYGRIFLRGYIYGITPESFNRFMQTSEVEEVMEIDMDEVAQVITGNRESVWQSLFLAKLLTVSTAVLY